MTKFMQLHGTNLEIFAYAEVDESATGEDIVRQVKVAFPSKEMKHALEVDRRVKNYQRLSDCSEAEARSAVAGRSGLPVVRVTAGGDGSAAVEDRRAENYRNLGLTDSQAREAARVGHPSGSSLTSVAESENDEARRRKKKRETPNGGLVDVTEIGGLVDVTEPARTGGN